MVAVILVIVIILIICNIDRLAKMSDELLAQTSRLNGNDASTIPVYHRSGAYWSSIVMLVLSLIGLVFKLMYWPFGNLILMIAGLAGLVFAWLTARHLVRVAPEERPVIRIAEIASLFLVANAAFKLFNWPFGNFIGILAISLLTVAFLVRLLKSWRGRA
jgi:ABC-type siderophore export system fused ATPase/permease subunit